MVERNDQARAESIGKHHDGSIRCAEREVAVLADQPANALPIVRFRRADIELSQRS
jgi:hypothetical protein